jgi:hypothetical protein
MPWRCATGKPGAGSGSEVTAPQTVNAVTNMSMTVSPPSTDATVSAQSVNIGKECTRVFGTTPWANYKWKREGDPVRTWVPVQRAQTGNKTTMKYEWSNSKETFMETGVEYGYKGASAEGGFSKSVVTSSGLNFSIDHQVVRDLEVEYDYYHYGLWCQLSGDATKWRYTNVRELRPYVFKGFSQSTTYSGYYRCTNAHWRGS